MNATAHAVLDLLKKKQIDRDAARILLESMPAASEGSVSEIQDKRIAIIGIAAELPGATSFSEFWNVLEQAEDRVSELPPDRRALCEEFVRRHQEDMGIDPDRPFWHAAWIDGIDKFEPAFFGITPAEARVMDPQQRRFLQLAYKCFEDAGYAGQRIRGTRTGVYVSAAMVNYADGLTEYTPQSVPGNIPSFVGARVSYVFDLHGPTYVCSSTCASSLVTLHDACLGLLNGDCDQALVGGVSIFPFPVNAARIFMNAAGIMSEDQRSRPFDNHANGIGRGEGNVALLIKPLAKALADHDNIHAVILGSAMNNDGTSAGITAPNPRAHTDLLIEAWRRAGVSPESLSYLEAHGTGTHLGDPIEIRGITDAVRKFSDRRQFLALGSVKGNIGHLLDGVAGLSGLMKTVHVLKRGVVPPTKYLEEPNRYIDFLDSPVFVPTFPWNLRTADQTAPLRAGVNCFGFNGTNVHFVLEEAPARPAVERTRPEGQLVFPLSARTLASLKGIVAQYAADESLSALDPIDIAHVLWSGREHFEQRVAVVAASTAEFLETCRALSACPMGQWHSVARVWTSAGLGGAPHTESDSLPETLAGAFARGETCPWHRLFEGVTVQKVALPTYVFEEESYWVNMERDTALSLAAAPHTTALEKVLAIAGSVLEIGGLTAESNFFACGGNSLSGLQLISRLRKEFACEFTVEDLFAAANFAAIAEQVSQSPATAVVAAIPNCGEAADYPVSFAQRRLWIIEQFAEDKTAYNVPFVFDVSGELDTSLLKRTFDTLSMRHEVLRTTFVDRDGELRQRIADRPLYTWVTADYTADPDGAVAALREIEQWKRTEYDLTNGPLLRVLVYKVAPGRTRLALMMHHIITDGWSLAVLSNELLRLYNADAACDLPPISLRYVDYCAWQRETLAGAGSHKQEAFWLQHLGTDMPVTEIVGDRPRPPIFRFTGGIRSFKLSPELTAALRKTAQGQGATLYMILLASVYGLIHRMSGQTDLVIGTPVSGRNHADLEPILGLLTNTLALRVQMEPQASFSALLDTVKQTVVTAFEHQDYPFDLLVDKLETRRDTSRSPIFNINVALQNFKFDTSVEQSFGGAVPEQIATEHHTCKWDLEFEFVELPNGELTCNLEYYDGLYSETFVSGLVDAYLELLRVVTAEPTAVTPVHSLPLLSDAVSRQLLQGCTGPALTPAGGDFAYLRRILDHAVCTPDAVAVADPGGRLTYGELVGQSAKLAGQMRELLGGDATPTALLLMENNRHVLRAMLAALLAGVTFVPVSPTTPRRRIQAIASASSAGLILTERAFFNLADRVLYGTPDLRGVLVLDAEEIPSVVVSESSDLMSESLWDFFAEKSGSDISASGWVSSYTGLPFSELEMREYAENAVGKIRSHLRNSGRIVELGCGSGFTTFAVAPYASAYMASDLSPAIIERNRRTAADKQLQHLTFSVAKAHAFDFGAIGEPVDAVVVNSVVHCFPSYSYLKTVLAQAVNAVREGGFIFLGDLLNLDLREEFVTSLLEFRERHRGETFTTKTDWETDLFVSPAILSALVGDLPAEIRLECSPKLRTVENELTTYRFDAILHVVRKESAEQPAPQRSAGPKRVEAAGNQVSDGSLPALPDRDPHSPAYILFTSGSTGQPKGVVVSHANLNNYLTWARSDYAPHGEPVSMPFYTSISFDLTVTSMFLPLLTGGRVYACPGDFDVALTRLCALEDQLVLKGTPKQVQILLEQPELRPEITCFILGGEALPATLCAELRQRFPHARIINEYGPTEATVGTVAHEVTAADLAEGWLHVPIGRPIQNTTVYIINDEGALVPPGGIGEIALAGASVALGYLGAPELTRQKFQANAIEHLKPGLVYRTGDLGQHLPDGRFLCFGRKDRLVKVRGFRVELEEIESHLVRLPGVRAAAVTVYRDASETEHLCAYVESASSVDPDQLRELLVRELPEYLVPTHILSVERIPLTPSGKLDRKALPAVPAPATGAAADVQRASTPAEKRLLAVWQDLLGTHVEDVRADFFALGGDSIKALRMIAAVRGMGLTFTIRDIFENRTIERLAALAEWQAAGHESVSTARAPRAGEVPLSPMQQWFFRQAFEQPHYWNLSMSVTLPQEVDLARLERALRRIIQSHEALLTWFEVGSEQVRAWCDPTLADTFALRHCTVSGASEQDERCEIERLDFEIQDSFRFSRRLPIETTVFTSTSMPPVLSLVVHHLVADGVSWRLLMSDLEQAYAAEGEGRAPDFLPAAQFSDWVRTLAERSEERPEALAYWRSLTADGVHPLCHAPVRRTLTLQTRSQRQARLDPAVTEAFLKARRLSAEHAPDAMTATAFAAAFAEVFGSGATMFLFEGHGRDEAIAQTDLSRTFGWFTTMFPVRVEAEGALPDMLRAVNRTLRTVEGGVDYMAARWVRRDPSLNGPLPTILLNYLGRFDGDIRSEKETDALLRFSESGVHAPAVHPDNHMPHNLELNLFVLDGELQAMFEYDPGLVSEEAAQALLQAMFRNIAALAHAEVTV